MQEIWKPVIGCEGLYEISNLGRAKALERQRRGVSKKGTEFVRNMKETIIANVPTTSGYLTISMTAASGARAVKFLVHRVVAEAFIENPLNLPWVNHKDGNKQNNHVDNLEWCTPSENILHAINTNLIPKLVGTQKSAAAKLNEEKVHVIKKMILLGFTNKELAAIFKVSAAPISYIRHNKAWTHVPW